MEPMTKSLIDKCFSKVVWITAEPNHQETEPTATLPQPPAEEQAGPGTRSLLLRRLTPKVVLKVMILFGALLAFARPAPAQDWKLVEDFRGHWKFKLGDNELWADPKYDDGKWDEIFVPANWEDEGYPGYDGYAWYRKHFTVSSDIKDKPAYIHIGYVDDVSEVYLNGHFVCFTGSLPPNYITAYNVEEKFPIPMEYINFSGDNLLAVRVYDDQGYGGINKGKPGIFIQEDYLSPDVDIAGTWKLKVGDDDDWAKPSFDDSRWKEVRVPADWETQGHKDYDGVGWYRIEFTYPAAYRGQDMVLLVGRIDDVDETYLNGERVGRTGGRRVRGDEYQKLRAYAVPADVINAGGKNVLAVRVYDNFLNGGIYDGPIGFVTRDHYRKWARKHAQHNDNSWDFFDIFR